MHLYKRGRTWWVDYAGTDGQRRRESTRCTDRKAAEAEGSRRERDARDPDAAAVRDETVERALLRLIDRTLNVATKRFYTQKSGHLVALLGRETPLAQLRANDLDGYLRARRAAVPAPSEHTIHKEVRTLSTALRLSKRCGLYRGDILALIPPTSAQYTPRDRWLPLHEVVALIGSYHQDYADQATSRPRPTAASDRRQTEQRQNTIRRSLVTRASVEVAKSKAFASLVDALDQRVRPEGLSDAEWACVCLRDAEPHTPAHVIAVALCCEVADRAEWREEADPETDEQPT